MKETVSKGVDGILEVVLHPPQTHAHMSVNICTHIYIHIHVQAHNAHTHTYTQHKSKKRITYIFIVSETCQEGLAVVTSIMLVFILPGYYTN